MKTVFDALYAKVQGSALWTAIGGRYFPIQIPEGTVLPCVVASIITETSTHELSHTFADILIEFSVLATSALSMHTVSEHLFTLYDRSYLTGLSGYVQLGPMDRDNAQPLISDGVYRYIIEYRLQLKKV